MNAEDASRGYDMNAVALELGFIRRFMMTFGPSARWSTSCTRGREHRIHRRAARFSHGEKIAVRSAPNSPRF